MPWRTLWQLARLRSRRRLSALSWRDFCSPFARWSSPWPYVPPKKPSHRIKRLQPSLPSFCSLSVFHNLLSNSLWSMSAWYSRSHKSISFLLSSMTLRISATVSWYFASIWLAVIVRNISAFLDWKARSWLGLRGRPDIWP